MPAKKKTEMIEETQEYKITEKTEDVQTEQVEKKKEEVVDIFNPVMSTVAKGLEGKVILVYGSNSLGKTKQATRMKQPFYLPFEQGLNAIAGVPYCPINKWSDFIKINKQLTDPATVKKARELYSTIIFDEIEAASNYCQEFICQKYRAVSIGEGNNGYGLWKEYETEFWKQINKLTSAGYCVYFIAHAQERDGFITPKADKRALSPILNLADLTVYVRSNGVDEKGRVIKSSGYLAETDEFFARSRFDYLPSTEIPEFTAENLEKLVIEAIELQEEAEGIKAVTYEEQKKQRQSVTRSYDDLMGDLQVAGENMAENGYLEELQGIVTNHLGEGKKASELRKGQEQVIEALLYDIEEFAKAKGI